MRRMVLACSLVLAGLWPCLPAAAADAAADAAWGLPQLMSAMAQVRAERRRFTERKYVPMLTAPLESSGILVYAAPGHLEKHTLLPRDERMVLDQGVVVLESRARHVRRTLMANQYPAIEVFVESMRATLAGDQKALSHYYQAHLEGQAADWRLRLVPNDPEARKLVREITIAGRRSRITAIEILEADGGRTVMTVDEEVGADGAQP